MNVQDVIQNAYLDHLYPAGINEPAHDILAGNITSSSATMTVQQLQGFFPQGPIEFQDTGELALTKESETTTTIDLMTRGYRGTTAASHSTGCVILIGPSFPLVSAFNALSRIVSQLPAWGVYQRKVKTDLTVDLTGPQSLPSDCKRIIDVAMLDPLYWQPLDQGKDFWVFPDISPPKIQFLFGNQGATTNIVYGADFTDLSTYAANQDLTATIGVPTTLQPHLALGVAAKLLMSRESPRVQLEAIASVQDNQGVPPGSMTAVGREMWKEFLTHVASERRRLHSLQRSTQIYSR